MSEEKKYPGLIKQLRERMGVTQTQLALMAGMDKGSIYRYEVGMSNPKAHFLTRIIEIAEHKAPDLAAGLKDEHRRLFGSPSPRGEYGPPLSHEKESLLASLRALLADERYARNVLDKLSTILLDMQEKVPKGIAKHRKVN